MSPIDVSVVIPCLNEARTIGLVIEQAEEAFANAGYCYEIIVADNGSVDDSPNVIRSLGSEVVNVKTRGYGAALLEGVAKARGSIVVFADADSTYDLSEGPSLVKRLMAGDVAMVIGTRMKGHIVDGAMPRLHRYVGTPFLTQLINVLFRSHITDCNSGFRALFKAKLSEWKIHSTGMEIASELIISCLKMGDHIAEVPITLRKGAFERVPHLSTWRDGMRHLLFILARAPQGFTYLGLALLFCSLCIAVPCGVIGPIMAGPIGLFDFHSMILAILGGFLGAQFMIYGLLLDIPSKRPLRINHFLLNIHEVLLMKLMGGLLGANLLFVSFIVFAWSRHGFNNIHFLRPGLSFLFISVVLGSFGCGIFFAQVQKRI